MKLLINIPWRTFKIFFQFTSCNFWNFCKNTINQFAFTEKYIIYIQKTSSFSYRIWIQFIYIFNQNSKILLKNHKKLSSTTENPFKYIQSKIKWNNIQQKYIREKMDKVVFLTKNMKNESSGYFPWRWLLLHKSKFMNFLALLEWIFWWKFLDLFLIFVPLPNIS